MNKRPLAIYLAVTFGLSWGVWIPAGILTGSYAQGINSSPLMIALVALGMFCPLIGALTANAAVGEPHRMNLRLRPLVRGNGRWYALAWLMPAVVTLLGGVLFFLLFPQLFDPTAALMAQMLEQAGQSSELLLPLLAGQMVFALTLAPLVNAIPSLGEEAGWRGMLFPSLCERMSERKAVLVSGVIWGIWHAPITAMGHNYGMEYPGFPLVGILAMVIFCTSVGCLLSWLYQRAGSVWPCAIAHGAVNAIANVGLYFCAKGQGILGPTPAGLVAGLPLLALSVVCWLHMSDETDRSEPVA